MKNLFKTKNKGFSMIELIVAIAIFSIVITIVLGLFINALRGYRKTLALQNVEENVRFLLNFMTKELRMVKSINSPNSPEGGWSSNLVITRSDDISVTYNFDATNNNLTRRATGPNPAAINSDDVKVTGKFYISGIGDNNLEPKLTVVLSVENKAVRPEEKAMINVQVTLSQRNIEPIEL